MDNNDTSAACNLSVKHTISGCPGTLTAFVYTNIVTSWLNVPCDKCKALHGTSICLVNLSTSVQAAPRLALTGASFFLWYSGHHNLQALIQHICILRTTWWRPTDQVYEAHRRIYSTHTYKGHNWTTSLDTIQRRYMSQQANDSENTSSCSAPNWHCTNDDCNLCPKLKQ